MLETDTLVECDDGAKLFIRRWKAESTTGAEKPAGLILVVHGMAEHSLRYRRLAETLCSRNFEVWAADMRGHGKTAGLSLNSPEKGGFLGHTADHDGFFRVVSDVKIITKYIAEKTKAEYGDGDLPFFMLGHSWGSFLVQAYIEDPASYLPLKGCILSGTRGPGGAKIKSGAFLLAIIAALKGARKFSHIAFNLSTGSYSKPFKPKRTSYDWITREEKEVDLYVEDPLCGMRCSSGFYRDMIGGLTAIHKTSAIARIDPNLPVFIFCGGADPVGDMGASPAALVTAYRNHGINDLEFVVYPEARHETLNETNREEVTENLLNWLLRHIP